MVKLLFIPTHVLLTVAMIAPVFALTGDVNGDSKVDRKDLAALVWPLVLILGIHDGIKAQT